MENQRRYGRIWVIFLNFSFGLCMKLRILVQLLSKSIYVPLCTFSVYLGVEYNFWRHFWGREGLHFWNPIWSLICCFIGCFRKIIQFAGFSLAAFPICGISSGGPTEHKMRMSHTHWSNPYCGVFLSFTVSVFNSVSICSFWLTIFEDDTFVGLSAFNYTCSKVHKHSQRSPFYSLFPLHSLHQSPHIN